MKIILSFELNVTEINFSLGDKKYDLNLLNSFSNSNILLFKE